MTSLRCIVTFESRSVVVTVYYFIFVSMSFKYCIYIGLLNDFSMNYLGLFCELFFIFIAIILLTEHTWTHNLNFVDEILLNNLLVIGYSWKHIKYLYIYIHTATQKHTHSYTQHIRKHLLEILLALTFCISTHCLYIYLLSCCPRSHNCRKVNQRSGNSYFVSGVRYVHHIGMFLSIHSLTHTHRHM